MGTSKRELNCIKEGKVQGLLDSPEEEAYKKHLFLGKTKGTGESVKCGVGDGRPSKQTEGLRRKGRPTLGQCGTWRNKMANFQAESLFSAVLFCAVCSVL